MDRWRNRYEWDYYSENRPRKAANGIKAKSERGAIGETWWSKRWVEALESFGMGTRLTRGRSYARQGQVLSIDVEVGIVKAKVQGSMRQPYSVKIRLQPFSGEDWEQVTEAMASQAIFAAKLLAGEMPTNIEDAFHTVDLSLLPTAEEDLDTDCSCPDWANPCKHIAAVYYILAERFDADPFLIFKLRGRTKDEIIAALREKRAATGTGETVSPESAESDGTIPDATLLLEDMLNTFWLAGEALDSFEVKPYATSGEKAVLKRLGNAPFAIERQNITPLLSRAYDMVEDAASRRMREGEQAAN